MAPRIIIGAVMDNAQDRNFTDSGDNIFTSGPHGRRCSEYYAGLNEVLDMTDSVKYNFVSLFSDNFSFLMNPNGPIKDRCVGIVSDML